MLAIKHISKKKSLKTLKLKIVFCSHIGNKLEINLKI